MAQAPDEDPKQEKVKKDIPLRKQIPFELVGRGLAGVDEMRESLDNSKVTFGLLQVEVGTGSFARVKNIFIHFNGEDIPPMKRSKANKFLKKAHAFLEPYQLALTLTRTDECTIDNIFKQAKGIFVSDNINKGATKFDLNALKADYQRKMAEAKAKAEASKKQLEESRRRLAEKQAAEEQAKKEAEMAAAFAAEEEARRLKEEEERKAREEEERRLAEEAAAREAEEAAAAAEAAAKAEAEAAAAAEKAKKKKKKGKRRKKKVKDDWGDDKEWTGKRIVSCIHADASPFNWAVFQPSDKEIIPLAYGHGDLSDLRRALKPDQVQYGVMRLTFGEGRFRRSHFIFIIWAPESMTRDAPPRIRTKKINERMTCLTWKGVMGDMIGPCGVEVTADDYDKVSLEDWILRVRKTVVVDGADDFLSAEGFRKALEEEKKHIEEMEKQRKAKLETGKKAAAEESSEELSDLAEDKGGPSSRRTSKAKKGGSGSDGDDPEAKTEESGAPESEAADAESAEASATGDEASKEPESEQKSEEAAATQETASSESLSPPKRQVRGSISPEEAKRRDLASRLVQESVTLLQRQESDIVWVLIEPRIPGSKPPPS